MKPEKQEIIVEVLELSGRNPNFQSLVNRWRRLKVSIKHVIGDWVKQSYLQKQSQHF